MNHCGYRQVAWGMHGAPLSEQLFQSSRKWSENEKKSALAPSQSFVGAEKNRLLPPYVSALNAPHDITRKTCSLCCLVIGEIIRHLYEWYCGASSTNNECSNLRRLVESGWNSVASEACISTVSYLTSGQTVVSLSQCWLLQVTAPSSDCRQTAVPSPPVWPFSLELPPVIELGHSVSKALAVPSTYGTSPALKQCSGLEKERE